MPVPGPTKVITRTQTVEVPVEKRVEVPVEKRVEVEKRVPVPVYVSKSVFISTTCRIDHVAHGVMGGAWPPMLRLLIVPAHEVD